MSLLQRAMDKASPAGQLDIQRLWDETRTHLETAQKENSELKDAIARLTVSLTETEKQITELRSEVTQLQKRNARLQNKSSSQAQQPVSPSNPPVTFATIARNVALDLWDFCGLELCGIGATAASYAAYSSNLTALWTVPAIFSAGSGLLLVRCGQDFIGEGRKMLSLFGGIFGMIIGGGVGISIWFEDTSGPRRFEPTFVTQGMTGESIAVTPYKYEPISRVLHFKGQEMRVTIPASQTDPQRRTLVCMQYWKGGVDVADKDLPFFDKSSVELDSEPYKESADCRMAKTWQAALAKSPVLGN